MSSATVRSLQEKQSKELESNGIITTIKVKRETKIHREKVCTESLQVTISNKEVDETKEERFSLPLSRSDIRKLGSSKAYYKKLEEEEEEDPELIFLTELEKQDMIENNQGLLHKIVNSFMYKSFRPGQYQRDDLVGVGMVGFTKALNSYKKNRNTKFSTYATKCITNEILYFLRKENKHNKVAHIDQAIATDKNGNSLTLEDTLEDLNVNVEATVLTGESLEFLVDIIENLSYNENYIIIHRYALFQHPYKTQKQIADVLGMSQANISKLESNILTKIRKIMMSKYGIKDLCFD